MKAIVSGLLFIGFTFLTCFWAFMMVVEENNHTMDAISSVLAAFASGFFAVRALYYAHNERIELSIDPRAFRFPGVRHGD